MSQSIIFYAIEPANFCEYNAIKIGELTDEEYGEEILDAILIDDNISMLPDGVEDIRGLIHNEPDDVYVREVEEGNGFVFQYFGISLEGEADLDEVAMEALSSLSKF